MIDGQLVLLTHRRHLIPVHVPLAGFAQPELLVLANHQLHNYSRNISDTILDDVSVGRSWLSNLNLQNELLNVKQLVKSN